jgi:hypothetical protein
MKKVTGKKKLSNSVVKMQFSAVQKKISAAPRKQKYLYTEKDLGEGLLYMGLSTPPHFAGC